MKEREVKAKHQQIISGVSIYAYWCSTLVWDILSYLPAAGLVVGVVWIYDVKSYITDAAAWAFVLSFLLYGPAAAGFTYATSFVFGSHSTAQVAVMFVNFLTGLCFMITSFLLTQIPSAMATNLWLRYLFRLFPSFCL